MTKSAREITKRCETICRLTHSIGGMGGKELNRGKGSVGDSNFLCLEYDDKADLAANETNS